MKYIRMTNTFFVFVLILSDRLIISILTLIIEKNFCLIICVSDVTKPLRICPSTLYLKARRTLYLLVSNIDDHASFSTWNIFEISAGRSTKSPFPN